MYNYWAYGLNIQSEIQFPELFETSEYKDPDAILLLGSVSKTLEGDLGFRSENIMISPTSYLLHVKGVASYFVSDGNQIVIEKDPASDWDSLRLFCLSNAFAALLHQRNLIPLHCSAFVDKGELVLIMGDSGAGKSTSLAGMINKGYKPFSDDVCVPFFKEESDELYLYSSYPMMKYWGDTYQIVDIGGGTKNRQIRADIDKYGVYFHEQFIVEAMRVKLVLLIEKDDKINVVSVKIIGGVDLFQRLERNAYRGEYLGFSGLQKEHFELFTTIAKSIKTFLISRPSLDNSVEGVVSKILELL